MFDVHTRAAQQHLTVLAWFRAHADLQICVLRMERMHADDGHYVLARYFPQTGGFDFIDRGPLDVIQLEFIGKLAGMGISETAADPNHERLCENDA